MPDFDAFWGSRGKAASLWDDPNRAVDVATMIQDHPTSVTLTRGSTPLEAQNVLANTSQSPTVPSGAGGQPGQDRLVLIGTRDHDTLDDFDVQKGDRLMLNGTAWRVIMVDKTYPGQTVATCEGIQ